MLPKLGQIKNSLTNSFKRLSVNHRIRARRALIRHSALVALVVGSAIAGSAQKYSSPSGRVRATCPSMPGLVAGLQRSGDSLAPLRIGMLWLDAHPDFNTPETTRSGSLGGMPVAVATGRALQRMRLDARLDPPMVDQHIVMGGVRLTDPLEQHLLDESRIEQVSVDDLRRGSRAVFEQLDRLARLTDKLYIHIDMDVLDPREVMGHGNKVPGGPSSEELARLFEAIFARYPTASAIGFATIPSTDEGGLSIAAVNRMIAAAVRGVQKRCELRELALSHPLLSAAR